MDHAVISMENSMENSMDGLLEKTTVKNPTISDGGFLQGFPVPEKSARPIWFSFSAPPAAGTAISYHEQIYNFVGAQPHTRRDGEATTLLVWRSPCARCGDQFEITTPLISSSPNRRCQACKAPGRKVKTTIAKDRAA